MRFLRTRLFVATFSVTTLILLGAGIFLYYLVRSSVIAEFDQSLLARAKSLASLVEHDGDRFDVEFESAQMPEFADRDRPEYFQIWAPDGTTLAKSPSLGDRSLETGRLHEGPNYRFVDLSDARAVRLLTVTLPSRSDHGNKPLGEGVAGDEPAATTAATILLSVARDTLDVERALSTMRWLLVVVLLGASLVSAGTMMAVVRHGLQPVSTLAERISRIDDRGLSNRIPVPDSVAELAPVVHRLNELLARLDQTIGREKAFTANVAHELRTPLAGLETALEVCVSKPRQEAEYRQVVTRCLDTTRAMRGMVSNLLMLGRADAGQLIVERESIEFDSFVAECWIPFEERASQRELRVAWDIDLDSACLRTDREKLRIVLYNLFDNAVRHSEAPGEIAVHIRKVGTGLAFEIKNSGCTIQPGDVDRVFDRFWKKDNSRSEGARHCGLGMPLSSQIVDILGGTITASAARDGTFVARVLLPMSI